MKTSGPQTGLRRAKGTMPFWNKQDIPAKNGAVNANPSVNHPTVEEAVPVAISKREDLPMNLAETGNLLLGAGAEFEGKLTFKGTVRIDSKFKGSITTNDVLVIGENAHIEADIICGTVTIQGELNGNIKATSAVELRNPARVRGNIESPSLSIEKGVVFQGESKMESAGRISGGRPAISAPPMAPAK